MHHADAQSRHRSAASTPRVRVTVVGMKPHSLRIAFSCLLLTLASCATPGGRGGGVPPAEFAAVLRAYETAWRARDADALAELFTSDGWVMSSGRKPVYGRAAIRERYKNSGGPLVLSALHWERQGNLAILLGNYGPNEGNPATGKFTLTLRCGADGRWRILSDMDNGNTRN